jgi:hypothetical protein
MKYNIGDLLVNTSIKGAYGIITEIWSKDHNIVYKIYWITQSPTAGEQTDYIRNIYEDGLTQMIKRYYKHYPVK